MKTNVNTELPKRQRGADKMTPPIPGGAPEPVEILGTIEGSCGARIQIPRGAARFNAMAKAAQLHALLKVISAPESGDVWSEDTLRDIAYAALGLADELDSGLIELACMEARLEALDMKGGAQ
jgi:hypothetical protein